MTTGAKLIGIKILHTSIWVFFNIVIIYLLYAVIVGKIDRWVWICLGCIALEGVMLLLFRNVCPVTLVARRYSNSNEPNFDIFLPNWLARYNKEIYSVIVFIAIVILIIRLIYPV
jgi:hypothetical protein